MLRASRPITRETIWKVIRQMGGNSSTLTSELERLLQKGFLAVKQLAGDPTLVYPQTFEEVRPGPEAVEDSRRLERNTGRILAEQA